MFKLGFGVLGIALTAPVIVVLPIAQAAGALPLSFLGVIPLLVYALLAMGL